MTGSRMIPAADPPAPSERSRRGPSLERRLPLLIVGLLSVAIVSLLIAIHGELERAAVETAHARLISGVAELGNLVDEGAETSLRTQLTVARSAGVRLFADVRSGSSADSAAIRRALDALVGQSPGRYAELVTPSGAVLMSRGARPDTLRVNTIELARELTADDTIVYGLPTLVDGSAYSPIAASIVVDGTLRGGLIRWSRIGAAAATEDAIRRIVDPRAEVFFSHPEAGLVIDPGGDVRRADFVLGDSVTSFKTVRDGEEMLGARTILDGSSWRIVALVPRDAIVLGSSQLFKRLVVAGIAIIILGAVVGWMASRSITKPLLRVTEAAEALARGAPHEPIALDRRDEIGRLAATFDEMTHRIADAHERLRAARTEAESANAAKSRFLGTMSHEIRTPLNAIIGYTEFLLVGIGGPVSAQQRAYVDRVQTSARHLLALVSDLLDLSSIEAGRLRVQLQPAPLRDAVHDAVAVLESQAHVREITIGVQCDSALWFRGDPARLRQILINLLSNAVKFSDSGGNVDVVCGSTLRADPAVADEEEQRWTTVTVRDTGIGIPPEKVAAIWDAFVQGDDSRTRTHGGSGLGLTISRRLARLMGGEITVTSEPSRGSEFTVWLPSSSPDSAANSVTAA
jgi:signal transduction histidine kinase